MERQFPIASRGRTGDGCNRDSLPRRGGFTLLELLLAFAIIGTISALTLPSIRGIFVSNNITRAGQMFSDQVNVARQIAAASNSTVEVRLLKLNRLSANGYSGIQLWGASRSGTISALQNVAQFPQGAVISENTNISPALSQTFDVPLPMGTMPSTSAVTANASYVSFHVRPSGLVLPIVPMQNFCFTVVPAAAATSGTLSANYASIQINPATASPFIYRP